MLGASLNLQSIEISEETSICHGLELKHLIGNIATDIHEVEILVYLTEFVLEGVHAEESLQNGSNLLCGD